MTYNWCVQVKQPEFQSGTKETNYMRYFSVFKSELTTLKQNEKFKLSNNSTVQAAAH